MQRDLYENVDGGNAAGSNSLDPEHSPLLPGSVKMHREANTSDKDTILIKNHFNSSDIVNSSSQIDPDLNYFDLATINKSNGMVIESRSHFSMKLNFGEIIYNKDGRNVTMMEITLTSHASLLEIQHFEITETEVNNLPFFVKLEVTTADNFTVEETPQQSIPVASNSSHTPSNVSLSNQQLNTTNSSVSSQKRVRRADDEEETQDNKLVREIWKKTEPLHLSVSHSLTLFEKKVLGINVKGTASFTASLSGIEVNVKLKVGRITLPTILSKKFTIDKLQGKGIRTGHEWKIKLVSVTSIRVKQKTWPGSRAICTFN